jgi:hypothetical protein
LSHYPLSEAKSRTVLALDDTPGYYGILGGSPSGFDRQAYRSSVAYPVLFYKRRQVFAQATPELPKIGILLNGTRYR